VEGKPGEEKTTRIGEDSGSASSPRTRWGGGGWGWDGYWKISGKCIRDRVKGLMNRESKRELGILEQKRGKGTAI